MTGVLQAVSHSVEETLGLAEKIALFLKSGDVVVLTGELGSGKTTFVKGIARALEIDDTLVNSPSFTIVNEYPGGRLPVYHFDLFRLSHASELAEVGWDEYLQRGGVVLVEWGERAENYLPSQYYQLLFSLVDEHERAVELTYKHPEA